jgi:hypothetical protein
VGAAVAAIAAAHIRRIRDTLDAFRVAGATTPGNATRPETLGLSDLGREVGELTDAGALRPGAQPGTLYLDEKGYIAWRDRRNMRARVSVAIVLLFAMVALGIAMFMMIRVRPGP